MTVLGAALGGALGGSLAGLAEAALIAATSATSEEYWLFPYAVVSYGLAGLGLAVVLGILLVLFALVTRRAAQAAFGLGGAVAFFCLGAVVARYHILQRIFAEQLPLLSWQGITVHAGLVLVFGILAAFMWIAGRTVQRSAFGLGWGVSALLFCFLAASAVAVLAAPRRSADVARRANPAAAGHPNVILIVVDTLRADALAAYGGTTPTPAFDGFGGKAVRFEDATAQSSWTRPSIATILTSLYPSVHGAVHKLDPLPDRVTTVAEALRSLGYWTAGFVSNINVAPIFNFQQGFEEFVYLPPAFYFGATDSATRLAIYKILRVARERLFRDRIYFYHYYQDAEVVNEAVLTWLAKKPPQPFFLLLHYMDPHDPYFEIPYNGHGIARVTNPNPPPEQADEMRRLYAQDVAYMDRHLDQMMRRLAEMGLFDGSVVALTADHGEEFLDHGGFWHGTTLYEEAVHVPLMMKRANEPQPGTTRARPARTLDIAPTLMAAAGFAPPSLFQGRDLFAEAPAEEPVLLAEEDLEGNVLASVRSANWKMVTANPGNPRGLQPVELYDLSRDPHERQNLAASEPARVQSMLQQLHQTQAHITGHGG
jgi:arylsulfatase